ncbi:hypothetical protein DNTS_028816 [Danionella cerebrum]|uniref:Uncharacterized protein n=1 Tax=Danionella cerebrum TaxID=2873325 RepID=A0A553PEI5_9TELE|nr:hypothetical protein DNTS_028816 [Danionella translucida]
MGAAAVVVFPFLRFRQWSIPALCQSPIPPAPLWKPVPASLLRPTPTQIMTTNWDLPLLLFSGLAPLLDFSGTICGSVAIDSLIPAVLL